MATDTDTLTRTERLIAWAALAIVLTMLNGCAWLLTSKHQVVVIERQNDTLQVTAVYYMAGDDYLLGLPAMMMRLTGLEPPAILQGTNATIDLRSAGELSGTRPSSMETKEACPATLQQNPPDCNPTAPCAS
jgi:hypothetical protein